jgi:hypothetical protein
MSNAMCNECKKLVGAGRHVSPHTNLVQTGFKKCSSAMGSADETHYRCSICEHKWIHETGSQGYGWIC